LLWNYGCNSVLKECRSEMNTLSPVGTRPFTEADLERLSQEGHRYELVRGELISMSPAGGEHGRSTHRLEHLISAHIYQHALGDCFAAETGFTIQRNPDTTLAPDWAFVRAGRLPEPLPRGFVPLAPDLVLETRSPGDTAPEVEEKVQLWLSAGVCAVLDLEPGRQRVAVCRAGQTREVLEPSDTLTLEDVFPGFSLPLARVFPS